MVAPAESQSTMFITMGTHCDLFWMGTHEECLERGTEIQRHALDLMEKYSEYCYYIETTIFADYHLRKYPQDKERMQRLIDRGQLEIGACFVDRVEHAHGGESIIRHAVEGIRWLNDTFGPGPRTAMHPDLPGISPQLPQIYAQAGIEMYLRARGFGATYDWHALDGSHILYCNLFGYGEKSPEDFLAVLSENELPRAFFVRGGYGDLQDVSSRVLEIVAEMRRQQNKATLEFASPGRKIAQFWDQSLPRLWGEMPYGWGSLGSAFVELMAQSVELEHRLLTVEKLIALAGGLGLEVLTSPAPEPDGAAARWLARHRYQGDIFGLPIPEGDELRELWRYELLCQDHNYGGYHGAQSSWDKESMRTYALAESERWIDAGLATLTSAESAQSLTVFNPVSWVRDEVLTIEDEKPETLQVLTDDGRPVPAQATRGVLAVQLNGIDSLGVKSFRLCRGEATTPTILQKNQLVSRHMIADIDTAEGRIWRLYDTDIGRDLVAHDCEHGFGSLVSYRDPGVDVRYNFTGEHVTDELANYHVSCREDGQVFSSITLAGEFLDSRVEKEYVLYKDLRRLDIFLRLWWWGKRQEHLFLTMPFEPTDYVETWYGVPFGAIRWPEMLHGDGVKDEFILDQGMSESMDMLAPDDRWHFREVIGWLDLAYRDNGVAVGTRSTCWWINHSELRASLLRTQYSCGDGRLWSLNPGFHEWRFRIQPHAGDWRTRQAYRVGEEILNPVVYRRNDHPQRIGQVQQALKPISIHASPHNVTVTTVKPSDFLREALVIRVLECEGQEAEASLSFPFNVEGAETVSLLEENPASIAVADNTVRFPLGAYQFKTIRLYLRAA